MVPVSIEDVPGGLEDGIVKRGAVVETVFSTDLVVSPKVALASGVLLIEGKAEVVDAEGVEAEEVPNENGGAAASAVCTPILALLNVKAGATLEEFVFNSIAKSFVFVAVAEVEGGKENVGTVILGTSSPSFFLGSSFFETSWSFLASGTLNENVV